MPDIRRGEKERDYMSRCILTLIKEGKKQEQAVAICYSMWKRGKRGKNFLSAGYLKSLENK